MLAHWQNEMDCLVRLSALSARVDRALQSGDSAMEVEHDIVLLREEPGVLITTGVDDYLRALQSTDQFMRLYRTGLCWRGRKNVSEPAFTKIPCPWLYPYGWATNKWCDFEMTMFSDVYMVFCGGTGYLLLMKGAPAAVVLKATLQRVERHDTTSEEHVPAGSDACPDDDISCTREITKKSTSSVAQFVAFHQRRFKRGIEYDTPPVNTYSAFEMEGSRVVLVFQEPKAWQSVEFHLTYELPTQDHTGWSAM
jgi:hypothetical protein